MKISLTELRQMVGEELAEAKKKKAKPKIEENDVRVDGNIVDHRLDFSKPLGGLNTYRQQGQSNMGPYTGDITSVIGAVAGTAFDTPLYGSQIHEEVQVRMAVRRMIAEALAPARESAWAPLAPEAPRMVRNIWEAANHWYDFQCRGLGRVSEETTPAAQVAEKHVGFKKMKQKLAHKKGVKNPGGLAHAIDVKKYGPGGHKAHPQKKG